MPQNNNYKIILIEIGELQKLISTCFSLNNLSEDIKAKLEYLKFFSQFLTEFIAHHSALNLVEDEEDDDQHIGLAFSITIKHTLSFLSVNLDILNEHPTTKALNSLIETFRQNSRGKIISLAKSYIMTIAESYEESDSDDPELIKIMPLLAKGKFSEAIDHWKLSDSKDFEIISQLKTSVEIINKLPESLEKKFEKLWKKETSDSNNNTTKNTFWNKSTEEKSGMSKQIEDEENNKEKSATKTYPKEPNSVSSATELKDIKNEVTDVKDNDSNSNSNSDTLSLSSFNH